MEAYKPKLHRYTWSKMVEQLFESCDPELYYQNSWIARNELELGNISKKVSWDTQFWWSRRNFDGLGKDVWESNDSYNNSSRVWEVK